MTDATIDDILAGMTADYMEKLPTMGPRGAQEIVGKLALMLAGQHRRVTMSDSRFYALVLEWQERQRAGTAFKVRPMKVYQNNAYRRVGYGTVNGRKRV